MDMRFEKTSLPRTGLLARVDVSSSAGLSHTWVELIYRTRVFTNRWRQASEPKRFRFRTGNALLKWLLR